VTNGGSAKSIKKSRQRVQESASNHRALLQACSKANHRNKELEEQLRVQRQACADLKILLHNRERAWKDKYASKCRELEIILRKQRMSEVLESSENSLPSQGSHSQTSDIDTKNDDAISQFLMSQVDNLSQQLDGLHNIVLPAYKDALEEEKELSAALRRRIYSLESQSYDLLSEKHFDRTTGEYPSSSSLNDTISMSS
jgi:hypothetical protein